jgi:hypothetical protein
VAVAPESIVPTPTACRGVSVGAAVGAGWLGDPVTGCVGVAETVTGGLVGALPVGAVLRPVGAVLCPAGGVVGAVLCEVADAAWVAGTGVVTMGDCGGELSVSEPVGVGVGATGGWVVGAATAAGTDGVDRRRTRWSTTGRGWM